MSETERRLSQFKIILDCKALSVSRNFMTERFISNAQENSGPNKISSQLEGSKIFTKKICEKFNIPTAKFGIFENKKVAKNFYKILIFQL